MGSEPQKELYILREGDSLLYMGSDQKNIDRTAIANGDGNYSISGIITGEDDFTTLVKDSFNVKNGKKKLIANGRRILNISTRDLQFLVEGAK